MFVVPELPSPDLAVFKLFTSVQVEPFQISVFTVEPAIKAAVCVPAPPKVLLAEFTSAISVQLVPSQLSTFVKNVLGVV